MANFVVKRFLYIGFAVLMKIHAHNIYRVVVALLYWFVSYYSLSVCATDIYDKYRSLPSVRLCKMGYSFMYSGRPDSALACLSVVAGRYNPDSSDGDAAYLSARAMNAIGYLYSTHYYDYNKAVRYYSKAQLIAVKYNYKDLQAKCYLNIGGLYRQYDLIHNTSKMGVDALTVFKKAFAFGVKERDWNLVVLSVFNMIGVADDCGLYRQMLGELDQFMKLDIPGDVRLVPCVRSMAQGVAALHEEKYDKALSFFTSMRRLADQSAQPTFYRISADICRCKTYLRKGDTADALAIAVLIDSVASVHCYNDILLGNLSDMERIYGRLGEKEMARRCRIEYLELKERLVSSTKIDDVRDAKFLSEIERMNRALKEERQHRERQNPFLWSYAVGSLVVVLILLSLIAYNRRSRRFQTSATRRDPQKEEEKYSQSSLSETEKCEIFDKIKSVMESSPEIYDNDFTLGKLSETIGVHYRFVSQVINEKYGKNFKLVLNDYRIKEACRRLKDNDTYGGYTIEAIALSLGFKSRSNFIAVFKRETGHTPKEFMKDN